VYSGDTNFAGSTSAVITIDSNNFTTSLSPTTISVAPGGTAATTLTITGMGPAQLLSLSCSGPSILGCAFTPASVSLAASGTATVSLVVAAAPTTPVASVVPPSKGLTLALLPFGTLLVLGLMRRRRPLKITLLVFLLCLGSLGMLSGCGDKSNVGTPLGSSTQTVMVNVSSTTASTTFTQSVALTVNVQ